MKKLLPFWLTMVFVLSACGSSAPIPTQTPTRSTKPYAVVSQNKAEFWFPLPDKQEWEWGFPSIGDDYMWGVAFGNPQDFATITITCGYFGPKTFKTSQTGSFEDMLKTCENKILISPSDASTTVNGFFTSSYSNGGLLIQITDLTWMQKLAKDKPQSILFLVNQTAKITSSKTRPSKGPYAVILPNKAEFWFPLPGKTEWKWNGPLQFGYWWSLEGWWMLNTIPITNVSCGNDQGKPLQTGSFEELLKVCKLFSTTTTLSYIDNGLLIEITDPDVLEALNREPSPSIYFKDKDYFEVIPIYK